MFCAVALYVSLVWGAGHSERHEFRRSGLLGGDAGAGLPGAMAGGGGGGGHRGSVAHLAGMDEVQKELGFSAEQQTAVNAIVRRHLAFEKNRKETAKRQLEQWRRGGHPRGEYPYAVMKRDIVQARQQARQQIMGLLSPAQAKRMEQLRFQDAGTEAWLEPDTVRALDLSREQQRRLAEIQNQASRDLAATGGMPVKGGVRVLTDSGLPVSPGEIIRRSEGQMLEEVLTAEQRARLKELQGAPFAKTPGYRLAMTVSETESGSGGGRSGGPGSAGGNARPQLEGGTVPRRPAAGGGGGSWNYYPLGGRGSMPRLASLAAVRKELGLSAEQQEALKGIIERLRESETRIRWGTGMAQLETPGPQKAAKWAEADEQLARVREQARPQIVGLLTPPQVKRLEQISLQDAGAEALSQPDVIQALGISPEQQRRLTEMQRKAKEEVTEWAWKDRANAPPGDSASQSLGEIVRRLDRRTVEQVLTAGQQTKLKELQGAPFAFPAGYRPPMNINRVSGDSGGGTGGGVR